MVIWFSIKFEKCYLYLSYKRFQLRHQAFSNNKAFLLIFWYLLGSLVNSRRGTISPLPSLSQWAWSWNLNPDYPAKHIPSSYFNDFNFSNAWTNYLYKRRIIQDETWLNNYSELLTQLLNFNLLVAIAYWKLAHQNTWDNTAAYQHENQAYLYPHV